MSKNKAIEQQSKAQNRMIRPTMKTTILKVFSSSSITVDFDDRIEKASRFPLDEGFVRAFDSFELLKKLNTTERERERFLLSVVG